jgi:hypothetical protein
VGRDCTQGKKSAKNSRTEVDYRPELYIQSVDDAENVTKLFPVELVGLGYRLYRNG